MNISTRIILIFLIILSLLSAVVFSMSLLANSRQLTAAAELQRFQSRKLADQLRQSSDDLTRMARTYVVTGDEVYEQYFFEILAIRNGASPRPEKYDGIYWDYVTATKKAPTSPGEPAALIELMKQVGITSQEIAKLEEAKKNSDQLTSLEIAAFGAMKGSFADDTGKFTIQREPDRAFARKILHGDQYHKAKAEIMRPIGQFLDLLDQRTRLEVTVNRANVDRYQIITAALVAVAILFSIFAFFHIRRWVIAPIVSLSGTSARIKSGAMDERAVVMSADEIGGLANAFNEMVENLQIQITERKNSEARFAGILDIASEGVIAVDADMNIRLFNQSAKAIFGYEFEEVLGRPLEMLMPEFYREGHRRLVKEFNDSGDTYRRMDSRQRILGLRKDGTEFPASASVSKLEIGDEKIYTVMLRDISELKRTEDALRQSQKMEAMGQLTGGVAHDFNNLLHVIAGNLDMLDHDMKRDIGAQKMIQAAMAAAFRGSDLIQKMLTFSREQTLNPKTVNANTLIVETLKLLERTLGEDIEIKTAFAGSVGPIRVDANQLGNAIVNLSNNARDAMPRGGVLTIRTSAVDLDGETFIGETTPFSGSFIVISVKDTGEGIEKKNLSHVFEPFFTTKEVGKGTGLGLSMVYGFVQQSGGHLTIESTEGEGTTVSLYFPAAGEDVAQTRAVESGAKPLAMGTETILVVEDDKEVRNTTVSALNSLGYTVLEAEDGPSAMKVLDENARDIDLVFSDVVMPSGMSGLDLARELRRHYRNIKILMTSGYPDKIIDKENIAKVRIELIAKPYQRKQLAEKLRAMFDG